MDRQRVILITGTSQGIGRYLAHYYAEKEFHVFGCSRGPVDFALEGYRHFAADITDEVGVKRMFGEIRRTHGRLDVLVSNAGIGSMNYVLLTPIATAQRIFNTNVVGTFLLCREAAKLMRNNRGGRIVNFTSAAALWKLEGEALYASSKAAVASFTKTLARELAAFGITVNAVGPSPVRTDWFQGVPEEQMRSVLGRNAIPRFCEFRDISNVIDFFIRPESDFVTGQVIYLGGP